MQIPLIVAYDPAAPQEVTAGSRELCRLAADMTGGTVLLAGLDADAFDDLRAWMRARANPAALTTFDSTTSAPMSSAPFLYREDGAPDWAQMWTTFCELALYGGPPHRGEDNPVGEPESADAAMPEDLFAELQRGIAETTGLAASRTDGPWIEVGCSSKRMAAWMCAAIILENVDARCEGEVLLLPAVEGYELTNQVKSIVTVIAKVHHYWKAHLMGKEPTSRI